MRITERKTSYQKCDKQGNLTKVDYIEIKDKGLAEEKLCRLEDIEDELGIDLITIFKALKQKFVYHNEKVRIELLSLTIKFNKLYLYGFVENTLHAVYLSLKDYGKTWALTKEELL